MANADIVTWIDADGATFLLTGHTNREVMWGSVGKGLPPLDFVEYIVPQQAGSRISDVRYTAREVSIPVIVEAESVSALRTAIRTLYQSLNAQDGDGKLRIQAPGGDERELYCRYIRGFEGDESTEAFGHIWQKIVLTFRAVDPFWYAINEITDTYVLEDPAPFFPFFPLTLSSSTVFADATINNTGDVDAWPVWVITGPGSNIILRNQTTGDNLSLTSGGGVTLASGEYLTIDTRPGYKTVTEGDGTNLFPYLSSDSRLWEVQPGANSVRVEMSGSDEDSQVIVRFYPRFLGY